MPPENNKQQPKHKLVLCVCGMAGSGKSTVAKSLAEHYRFKYYSGGDALKAVAADMGYEKAPVSYDGELVRSWGGGVCQASTTLYNAALLAGLEIVERHRHHWPARYAPLGRDAAVAYNDIDLRFRNTLSAPIRIEGEIVGENLVFRILSSCRPEYTVRIESQTRSVSLPNEVIQDGSADGSGRRKLINRGHPGFYVATYRTFVSPNGSRRELLSEDRYPAMNRIVRVADQMGSPPQARFDRPLEPGVQHLVQVHVGQ